MHSWNLYTMWAIINASCKPSLGALGHVTKMLQAENEQKVDNLELIYLGKHQFLWNMICGFWTRYQPPFFWLSLFTQLKYCFVLFLFLFFFFCFFFFFFSSHAIYCQVAKRTVFKVWAIEDIREDFCATEIRSARLGVSPSIGPSKILNF